MGKFHMGKCKQNKKNALLVDKGIKYNLLIYTYTIFEQSIRDPATTQFLLAGKGHDLLFKWRHCIGSLEAKSSQ